MRMNARLTALTALDLVFVATQRPDWRALVRLGKAPHAWVAAQGGNSAVVLVGGVVLWLVAAWLGVGLSMAVVTTVPGAGGRLARRFTAALLPRVVRQLLAAGCGLVVLTAPMAAGAGTAGPSGASVAPSATYSAPVWPTDSATPTPAATSTAGPVGAPVWPTDPAGSATARPPTAATSPPTPSPPTTSPPTIARHPHRRHPHRRHPHRRRQLARATPLPWWCGRATRCG